MAPPQLGQQLSLISKSGIRYEGSLSAIDPAENTLTLANVQMMGTESRPAPTFIDKEDQLYEFIVFRGNDIKDLTVYHENSRLPVADPAIVSAGRPVEHKQAQHVPQSRAPRGGAAAPSYGGYSLPSSSYGGYSADRGQAGYSYGGYGGFAYGGGKGGGRQNYSRGGHGGGQRRYNDNKGGRKNYYASHTGFEFAKQNPANKKGEIKEFDFDAMQKKIDELEKDKKGEAHAAYHKEKSFFDELSLHDKEPQTHEMQRKKDAETFGLKEVQGRGRGGPRGRH